MTRGKLLSHQTTCGYRIALGLQAIVAGGVIFGGAASAQQQAPAAKPAPVTPPKPAAPPAAPKPPTAAAPAAPPAPGGLQPTLLGQYGDWGAYTASPGGKKICFVLAKPANSSTSPPNRPRDPAWMFLSPRPAEKAKHKAPALFLYGPNPTNH